MIWAAVALIIALVAIWAVYSLLIYGINKDTEVTTTPVVDENGEETEWVLVCKGGTCQYFNRATGETTEGPSNDSILSKLLMPIVVVAVVGVGAYAAVKVIGAVRTSVYIYLTPVVTVLSSVLILHEVITPAAFVGILLTLSGLFISERRSG